jgi:hypothetical protein
LVTEPPVKLEILYRATTYRVKTPETTIDIRIGDRHPMIDRLLSQLKATQWAFVSAWNPGSRQVSADANASAQDALVQFVAQRGFAYYEGAGIPDSADWSAETSLWIAGISGIEARELGLRFKQNAIVFGELGGTAELVSVDWASSIETNEEGTDKISVATVVANVAQAEQCVDCENHLDGEDFGRQWQPCQFCGEAVCEACEKSHFCEQQRSHKRRQDSQPG